MLRHEKYVTKTKWDKIKDNIKGLLSAILIALAIRVFLVEPYKIPTPSMYPTILEGDMIMANKFWYGVRVPVLNWKLPAFSTPDAGDVLLFETPTYQSPGKFTELLNFVTFGIFALDNNAGNPKYFIKRTVGTPGDTVQIVDPRTSNFNYQLVINGKKAPLKTTVFPGDFRDKEAYLFFVENLGKEKHYVQFLKQNYHNAQVYFPQDIEGDIYIPEKGDSITFSLLESHDNIGALKEGLEAGVKPDIHVRDRIRLTVQNEKRKKEIVTSGRIIRAIYHTGFMNTILQDRDLYDLILKGEVKVNVNEDFYFVMGDNRDNSSDSRFWGFVNHELLLGNPLFRHYPFSRFGGIDQIEEPNK